LFNKVIITEEGIKISSQGYL